MCGIVAQWNINGAAVVPEAFREAVKSLRHRGPDDEGVALISSRSGKVRSFGLDRSDERLGIPYLPPGGEASEDLALGHTRLSILDLSPTGHQPMGSEDGRLWIVFNGEIYNFRELREELSQKGHRFRSRTDTEVVLAAYREWGTECLSRFNGMWAFALWDGEKRRLFVARDRFGVKPLVYHIGPGVFVCASEIKAILKALPVPRDLDKEALHHYLSLTFVPDPFTIFKEIRKLPPGHFAEVNSAGIRIERYWTLGGVAVSSSEEGAAKALESLLTDSVSLRLVADVGVGAFLSGGVDSSVVCALANRQRTDSPLETYSIGFRNLPDYDETHWAAAVAKRIQAQHTSYELSMDFEAAFHALYATVDEPFASPSAVGLFLLAQAASKREKVVLTGDGGDEVFAGYDNRHWDIDDRWDSFKRRPLGWLRTMTAVNGWAPIRWRDETLPERLRRRWRWEQFGDQEIRDRHYTRSITWPASEEEKQALYAKDWREETRSFNTQRWLLEQIGPPETDRIGRWQRFDLQTTLAGEMLSKVDKATMACGLEARTPLLDYRVVQFGVALRPELKRKNGQPKYLLKKVAAPYLPEDALTRPKHGFGMPLGLWFKSELRGMLCDSLAPAELNKEGIFDTDEVAVALRHHVEGLDDYCYLLYNLLCLQEFLRRQRA